MTTYRGQEQLDADPDYGELFAAVHPGKNVDRAMARTFGSRQHVSSELWLMVDSTVMKPHRYAIVNLMQAVDRWVVRNTLTCLDRKFRSNPDSNVSVAINLSGSTVSDHDFFDFVREQFVKYKLPEGIICFEVTETAAIANLPDAIKLIRELKKLGCKFALDEGINACMAAPALVYEFGIHIPGVFKFS